MQVRPSASAEKKDGPATEMHVRAPAELYLCLNYMQQFSKAASLAETVSISMSSESPVLFEYSLGALGRVCFFLAPKIEEMGA